MKKKIDPDCEKQWEVNNNNNNIFSHSMFPYDFQIRSDQI